MEIFEVKTSAQTQMIDITSQVQGAVDRMGLKDGMVVVYCPHTTGGVTINEGADPAVKRDIVEALNQVIPWDLPYHHAEGNSPAHIKSSLVGASATVIVEGGRLCLGTWQKLFFCEFDGPRTRKVWVKGLS